LQAARFRSTSIVLGRLAMLIQGNGCLRRVQVRFPQAEHDVVLTAGQIGHAGTLVVHELLQRRVVHVAELAFASLSYPHCSVTGVVHGTAMR
jgi:hypothetical protein